MKPCRLFVAAVSALALSAGSPARGQEAIPATPETPAIDEITLSIQTQAEEHLASVQHGILLAQAATEATAAPGAPAAAMPAVQQRLQKIVSRGRPNAGKTLVIRSSDTDPKVQANMEEDLSVMSRVLDKAATQQFDNDRPPRAMGIDVFFAPGSSPMRTLYLEGYGALFLLNANFPLMAPPEKAEKEKETSQEDSAWHQAKRELYGPREGWDEEMGNFKFGLAGGGPGQPYDPEKVANLKRDLLDALKNAANIRNLKADESITVCVFGASSSRPEKTKAAARRSTRTRVAEDGDSHEVAVWSADDRHQGPGRGSVMTIRVKKADVDAFAKGKLDPEDFAKKASVTTYAADTGGWGGSGVFGLGY